MGNGVMKKVLLGGTLLSVIAFPAVAADMRVKAPLYKAPPPVPVFSWSGCYGGVNAGYAWSKADVTANISGPGVPNPNTTAFALAVSPSIRLSGFTGGVQAGCNYQIGAL